MAGTAQSERGVDSLSRIFRENRQEEVEELPMGKEWIWLIILKMNMMRIKKHNAKWKI